MNKIEIYIQDNSELSELEAINRGYRSDVFISIDGKIFQLFVYDPVRLVQDFESEMEDYNFFAIEPNLILVPEVNIENIKFTIGKLCKQKYFERIKEIELDNLHSLHLIGS